MVSPTVPASELFTAGLFSSGFPRTVDLAAKRFSVQCLLQRLCQHAYQSIKSPPKLYATVKQAAPLARHKPAGFLA
jgi:hypothetical protein